LAKGNIRGICEAKRMKKQDKEMLRKAVIVRFTKCFEGDKIKRDKNSHKSLVENQK
jgi:hypothetical protein